MANTPASGNLSITFTQLPSATLPAIGTVRADQGTVTDPDGIGAFSYQWQLSSDGGVTWSNISGATAQSYTFAAGDFWKTYRVTGSFVDGGGSTETVTSNVNVYGDPKVVPVGTPGNDVILGDLTPHGPTSPYKIDVGAGFDVVTYNSKAVYTAYDTNHDLIVGDGPLTLISKVGYNLLHNAEEVRFTDVTLVLDVPGGSKDNAVYAMYQATFDRMPDKAGFRYWAQQVDNGSLTLNSVAATFVSSPEFQQKYGTPDNRTFIQDLYSNALHRTGDQPGVDYWTAQADRGVGRDQLLLSFATSQESVNLLASHTSGGYWVVEA